MWPDAGLVLISPSWESGKWITSWTNPGKSQRSLWGKFQITSRSALECHTTVAELIHQTYILFIIKLSNWFSLVLCAYSFWTCGWPCWGTLTRGSPLCWASWHRGSWITDEAELVSTCSGTCTKSKRAALPASASRFSVLTAKGRWDRCGTDTLHHTVVEFSNLIGRKTSSWL